MADLAVSRSLEAEEAQNQDGTAHPPRKKRKRCVSLAGKNKSYVTEEISSQLISQQQDSWKELDW